jgi:ribonuclease HI
MSLIYTDGSCGKHTHGQGWGSVVDEKGGDLLAGDDEACQGFATRTERLPVGQRRVLAVKFKDVASQQNNAAELVALIAGLRIALRSPKGKIVCCDSELLTRWWSKGHINAKTRLRMDPGKRDLIDECARLRAEFEKAGGEVRKISGENNLADLGYHSIN